MKKYFLAIFCLSIALTLSGCDNPQASSSFKKTPDQNQKQEQSNNSSAEKKDDRKYTNTKYGFSVELPEGWEVKEVENELLFISPSTKARSEENMKNCEKNTECETEALEADIVFLNTSDKNREYCSEKTPNTLDINGYKFSNYKCGGLYPLHYLETEKEGKIYSFYEFMEDGKLQEFLKTFSIQ